VLVLVGELERQLLALQGLRYDFRNRDLDLLAALEPVALHARLAVHLRSALLQQALRGRAGTDLGQRGEEAVEPLARRLGRDGDAEVGQRERVSPSSRATNRIATPTTMKLSARLKAGQ